MSAPRHIQDATHRAIPLRNEAAQTMNLMTITPQVAQSWLSKGSNFRVLDKKRAKRMAEDIVANGWALDGNPIKFDSSDALVDGQHRLHAIVLAGISVKAWVMTGADPSTVDTGKARTASQMFRAEGKRYYEVLASAATLLWRHDHGTLSPSHTIVPTLRDVAATEEENPLLERAADACAQFRLGPASHLTFLNALISRATPQLAARFTKAMVTGSDLEEGDPILLFRNRMIVNKASVAKLHTWTKLALLIVCWNKWHKGEPTRTLRLRSTEEWPEIIIPTTDEPQEN
jgi:hypothetical protein